MPTQEYESLAEAYQALVDIEIMDDGNDYPVAKINLKELKQKVTITMLCEYDYWYTLEPLRVEILDFYINRFAQEKNIMDGAELLQSIKSVYNQIETCETKEDVMQKAAEMQSIFKPEEIRKKFFRALKKLGVISKWMGWKKWQKAVKPPETLMIFIFLWLFNFDGVKKNVTCLIEKIGAVMREHSSTGLSYSENWDSFKQMIADGEKRVREKLAEASKN